MNLTQPWTETAKRDEYRRATWRQHVLDEAARYDDDPLTVLNCRQPQPGTPEEQGHRDAEDAHRRNRAADTTATEQDRARRALHAAGVPFADHGYGFHVRGRSGHWLAPAEILTLAEQGRLR